MKWKRILFTPLLIGLAGYLLLVFALIAMETQIVYPAPRYPQGDWNAEQYGAVDVNLESSDGVTIHGWYFEQEGAEGALLFCHGNGEHVAYNGLFGSRLARAANSNVFVFDYRGYGKSSGAPYETGVLADADAALQWLAQENGISPSQVTIFGRSLGGGVACHLAQRHGTNGLILQSTFSSMVDTAGSHYPYMPVTWAMRNRYNSVRRLQGFDEPLLQLHGDVDRVVPIAIGRRLFDSVQSDKKKFVVLPGCGHNNVPENLTLEHISMFVRTLGVSTTGQPEF